MSTRLYLLAYVEKTRQKHHDMLDELMKNNEDVRSLSFCDSCHTKADQSIFDDVTVFIPNHSGWDD